jgi:carboxyl-terminal processing protease
LFLDALEGDYRRAPVVNRQILTFLAMALAGCAARDPWARVDAARRVISGRHVQPPAEERLADAAVRAMVAELDPHSVYLTEDELRWFEEDVRGSYGGVGIEVIADGDAWRIVGVVPSAPADRAGVRTGDRVLAVNGVAPGKAERTALLAALRGPVGGTVTLRVEAKDRVAASRDVVLTRALVTAQSVLVEEPIVDANGVAVVRIRQFQDTTPAAFAAAEARLLAEPRLRGLVLDLRGNPGGLVDVARAVADRFVASGAIHGMVLRGREARDVMAAPEAPLGHLALAVLVDASTASAAELLAAALRDRVGALIVGERTFGKGTVQILVALDGGGALDVTVGEYRTACGASIQAKGLEPDLVLGTGEPSRSPQREEDLPRVLHVTAPREAPRSPVLDPLVSVVRPADPGAPDPAVARARDALAERLSAGATPAPRGCRL